MDGSGEFGIERDKVMDNGPVVWMAASGIPGGFRGGWDYVEGCVDN
jgi:hypothetical protein